MTQRLRRAAIVGKAHGAGPVPTLGNHVDRVPRRLPQQDAADFLGGLGAQLDVALDAVKRRVRA